jgi:hypothetical protein
MVHKRFLAGEYFAGERIFLTGKRNGYMENGVVLARENEGSFDLAAVPIPPVDFFVGSDLLVGAWCVQRKQIKT